MKKQTTIVLGFAVGTVALLTAVILLVVSTLLSDAVTQAVSPFLSMSAQLAANAASPGLQLDSKTEVESALKVYVDNPVFTYVRVTNRQGTEVLVHRMQGLTPLSGVVMSGTEIAGEMFHSAPIQSNVGQLGTLTLGMSLTTRDAVLSAARRLLLALG